jgi:hypothetical protein
MHEVLELLRVMVEEVRGRAFFFLVISGKRDEETLFESVPTLSKMSMAISFRTNQLSRSAMDFARRTESIENTSMALLSIPRRLHEQAILLCERAMALSMKTRYPLKYVHGHRYDAIIVEESIHGSLFMGLRLL